METSARICILGESPLVEEYAALCISKGLEVQVRMQGSSAKAALPKQAKKIAKPNKLCDVGMELTNTSADAKKKNLIELDKALPTKAIILSSSVTLPVTEQAEWVKNPERLVGIGAMPSLLQSGLIELAKSSTTNATSLAAARQFIGKLGKDCAVVQDSVGMVLPRILSMLVNEACFALADGVAGSREIDSAMKLGTNYPYGAVEWGERLNLRHVFAVMQGLYRAFEDDRYKTAPLLQRAAKTGVLAAS